MEYQDWGEEVWGEEDLALIDALEGQAVRAREVAASDLDAPGISSATGSEGDYKHIDAKCSGSWQISPDRQGESRAEPEVADDFCFDSHCGEYLDCVDAHPKACLSSCALKHTEHRSSQECTFMAETELRTDEMENSAKRANGTDSETGTTTKQSTLSAWLGVATKKRPTNPLQKVQSNIRSFFGGGADSNSPAQLESAPACKLNKKPRVDAPRARAPAWRQERQAGTCPAYKWVRGTNITVDAFKYGNIKRCEAYFLSHFHADHYMGLGKQWDHGLVYCSPATARLVQLKLRVDPKMLMPLAVGWAARRRVAGVEVTLLEANHCPGAVVFVFRPVGQQEYILHTGDFRAPGVLSLYPELTQMRFSSIYLDTTYCDPSYVFPPQSVVLGQVVELVRGAPPDTLFIVGAYSIGKEHVYLTVAETLGCEICVEADRLRTLQCIEWPRLVKRLTTDKRRTPLHVVPMARLRAATLRAMLDDFRPRYKAVMALRPTGWTFAGKGGSAESGMSCKKHGAISIYGVPYSEHSAFNELREFVQQTRPRDIIPTVNVANSQQRDAMQAHFAEWMATRDQGPRHL